MAVNIEKVFDMLTHAVEKPNTEYKLSNKISLKPKEQKSVIQKSINSFMQTSARLDGDVVIQAFSGSSDLPELTKDIFSVSQAVPQYDTLYQKVFQGIRLKKGQLSWEIADVDAGIVFELIPEGAKVSIRGVSGSKINVDTQKYGAGIGVTWEMIEGRKLYQFINVMLKVRSALNNLWADVHYKLLSEAGAKNKLAWQTGTSIINRDISTLNEAYSSIGEKCKDKSYGDVANIPMELYFQPKLKARIMSALRTTNSDAVRSGATDSRGVVEFNINPNATWNGNIPQNKALLVLPKNKIQNAVYMREKGFQETDITTLSDIRTYWSVFGAAVGDSDQVAELSFA